MVRKFKGKLVLGFGRRGSRRLVPGRGEHERVHAQSTGTPCTPGTREGRGDVEAAAGRVSRHLPRGGRDCDGHDRFCKTYQPHVLIAGAASRDREAGLSAPLSGTVHPRARPRRDLGFRAGQARREGEVARRYAGLTLLVIDEWLHNPPTDHVRNMLLELLERRYDTLSTVFCTQYAKKDLHRCLDGGVHADAIMDRIVQNTIWIETGSTNMREHSAMTS